MALLLAHRTCLLQIAVLKELEGKGTYCSLVAAGVVVKDVLLFAAFAVNVELARALVGGRLEEAFAQLLAGLHT